MLYHTMCFFAYLELGLIGGTIYLASILFWPWIFEKFVSEMIIFQGHVIICYPYQLGFYFLVWLCQGFILKSQDVMPT